MLKISFGNLSKDVLKKVEKVDVSFEGEKLPAFAGYVPDIDSIKKKLRKYKKFKNVILIGNGGSRTSAYVFYHCLEDLRNKTVFEFLTSAEPGLIRRLRRKYGRKDTLVLIVSKSGDNINAFEPLLSFFDYPVLVVTGGKPNTLSQIAARKNWEIIIHPEVGGRFSGMTESGLVPACLMGLDIDRVYAGARSGYKDYGFAARQDKNPALIAARIFNALEGKGYTEIFSSIYSFSLSAFLPLMVQLVHESIGKDGKGMTIYGDYSPESQHHTNQRIFGGQKNAACLFMYLEDYDSRGILRIPKNISDIEFKGVRLKELEGLKASETMLYDMQGVQGNCLSKKIPFISLAVPRIDAENTGNVMAFWHYFTVYSALLRGQNPYDQPEVEAAKILSFKLRIGR